MVQNLKIRNKTITSLSNSFHKRRISCCHEKNIYFFIAGKKTKKHNHVQPRFNVLLVCKSFIPAKDKTIKLWKVSERDKRPEGYNLKDEEGRLKDMTTITSLQVAALLLNHPPLDD